jgi:A-factor type gamma-butyrolactone 1'-reductase (1S-forming)
MLGRPGRAPYNSSRSAVIGLTRTAAMENIRRGIRVNAVAPSTIDTDIFRNYARGDKALEAEYAEAHPIGRIGRPEEVADAVAWLCSEESSFVVGQALVLDGGFTAL